MPKVCYYKPNRTKDRPFKLKDLQRIAKLTEDEAESPEQVLAYVIVGLGLQTEWRNIQYVYRGVRIAGSIMSAWVFFTRARTIIKAIKAIYEEVNDRLAEFPGLRQSISISGEAGRILGAIVGILGGVVGSIRLILTYDSDFVDNVGDELTKLGEEPLYGDELDKELESLLSDDGTGEQEQTNEVNADG